MSGAYPPESKLAPSLSIIGNFDGVHRGHLDVLAHAGREAALAGLVPRVLTFDPPPAVVLGRTPPAVLTPLERKIELIEAAVPGVQVLVKTFDLALAAFTPDEFARKVLVDELSAQRVFVGANFRFGQARSGDLAELMRLGEGMGFAARALPIAGDERGPWSSTRARQSIAAGDFADVFAVLGRPHALTGTVVRGDQRGRTLGFPTANLAGVEELLPPYGVYAVLVDRLDSARSTGPADQARLPRALARGVANIGVRPTVGGGPSIEAHLLDFHPTQESELDLYGARLRIHLVEFLRGERKFGGLEALKTQIAEDANDARAVLSSQKVAPGPFGGWY